MRVRLAAATARATGDHALNPGWTGLAPDAAAQPASVLLPIVPREGGAWVLLTRRAEHLPQHAGQIAFPGGKMGRHDGSPLVTALRESEEEIGLQPSFVEVIGRLADYHTASGFVVAPFIGILRPGFSLCANAGEVSEIVQAPLEFLMTQENHRVHGVIWRGRERRFYAMAYKNHYIWGATAGILRHMYERLYSE